MVLADDAGALERDAERGQHRLGVADAEGLEAPYFLGEQLVDGVELDLDVDGELVHRRRVAEGAAGGVAEALAQRRELAGGDGEAGGGGVAAVAHHQVGAVAERVEEVKAGDGAGRASAKTRSWTARRSRLAASQTAARASAVASSSARRRSSAG